MASVLVMDNVAVRVSVLLEFTTGSKVTVKSTYAPAASSVTVIGTENV